MATTKTRVNKIANVCVPVADQDRAVEFYVGKLGLEMRVDVPFGEGDRWIEVGLPGQTTTIAIGPPPFHANEKFVKQPARTEMIVNEIAKFVKLLQPRASSCL